MLRGFYTAASGILLQERTIDVLTNNIANARTPGFRASRVVSNTFDHELLTRIEGVNTRRIGVGSPIRKVEDVLVNFNPNSLEETYWPYDMALDGLGYFNIQSEDGTQQFLSRNGNFDLDEQNRLILPGHGYVLGENGTIELATSDFIVDTDGSIYDDTGTLVDKLLLTIPPEGTKIEQMPNGLYSVEDMAANLPVDPNTKVVQGWLERNNININQEYTMVMEAQRAFQANSSALQIIDQIDQKAAAQIASL